MTPDDRIRLQHIVDSLNSAIRFVEGRQRGDLDTDQMLLFALARAIEVAGEAASKIARETRGEILDVPWNSIIGMRNRLEHAYVDVDNDILWTTVTEAAPSLVARLTELLAEG